MERETGNGKQFVKLYTATIGKVSAGAVIAFALIADRIKDASDKYTDENGKFCIYPVKALAEDMGESIDVVKRYLKELKKADMIRRELTKSVPPKSKTYLADSNWCKNAPIKRCKNAPINEGDSAPINEGDSAPINWGENAPPIGADLHQSIPYINQNNKPEMGALESAGVSSASDSASGEKPKAKRKTKAKALEEFDALTPFNEVFENPELQDAWREYVKARAEIKKKPVRSMRIVSSHINWLKDHCQSDEERIIVIDNATNGGGWLDFHELKEDQKPKKKKKYDF